MGRFRSSQFSNRKVPRDSRSIPLPGTGEDTDKYYRCWNCGFVCKAERDSEGESAAVSPANFQPDFSLQEDANSINPSEATIHGQTQDGVALMLLPTLGPGFVCPKLGPDGEEISIFHYFEPSVYGGCPFCGTRNWRASH